MDFVEDILTVSIAYADDGAVAKFVGHVNRYILNPLIIFMFAAALMYFLYGLFLFQVNKKSPGENVDGRNHMMWGLIGMFIMFAVGGIITFVGHTLGVNDVKNIPGV